MAFNICVYRRSKVREDGGAIKRKRTKVQDDPPDAADTAELDDTGEGCSDGDSPDIASSYASQGGGSGNDAGDMERADSDEDVADRSRSDDTWNGTVRSTKRNGDNTKDSVSFDQPRGQENGRPSLLWSALKAPQCAL